jgi:hypothetical protein
VTRPLARRLVGAAAATAAIGATALLTIPNARADSPPSVGTAASASCSEWVSYQKRACLNLDGNEFSASVDVGQGGRGWYGYISITDPSGTEVAKSPVQVIRAGASGSVGYTAGDDAASGEYCAIDNRWDAYHSTFYVEAKTCLSYVAE